MLLQLIIDGFMMGCVYSLIAIGLTIVFGVMKIINFAHGSLLMAGLYLSYWLWSLLGINIYLAGFVVVPACFLMGYYLQKFAMEPFFRRERAEIVEPTSLLLITIGLFMIMDNLALLFFSPDVRNVDTSFASSTILLGDVIVGAPKLVACICSLIAIGGLHLFFRKTFLGRAVLAVSQDREAAILQGIDSYYVFRISFGIAAAVTGLSSVLIIPFYYVYPSVGLFFGIRAFVIVVLGGMGSFAGVLLGGVLIGLIEGIGSNFSPASTVEGYVFLAFITILLFRPSGFFGKKWKIGD
jgi:branched-chain amino acid transport system permease protein